MIPLDFNKELKRGMEIVVVCHAPYLFTNMRIDRDTIPDGYYAYDVRESDGGAGDFSEIQPYVMVNHWGTLVGKREIPMDEKWGCYFCTEDDGDFQWHTDKLEEYEKIYNSGNKLETSAIIAASVGVPEDEMLHNLEEVDDFFGGTRCE